MRLAVIFALAFAISCKSRSTDSGLRAPVPKALKKTTELTDFDSIKNFYAANAGVYISTENDPEKDWHLECGQWIVVVPHEAKNKLYERMNELTESEQISLRYIPKADQEFAERVYKHSYMFVNAKSPVPDDLSLDSGFAPGKDISELKQHLIGMFSTGQFGIIGDTSIYDFKHDGAALGFERNRIIGDSVEMYRATVLHAKGDGMRRPFLIEVDRTIHEFSDDKLTCRRDSLITKIDLSQHYKENFEGSDSPFKDFAELNSILFNLENWRPKDPVVTYKKKK